MIALENLKLKDTVLCQTSGRDSIYGVVTGLDPQRNGAYVLLLGSTESVFYHCSQLTYDAKIEELYRVEAESVLATIKEHIEFSRSAVLRDMTKNLQNPDCELTITNRVGRLNGSYRETLITTVCLVGCTARTAEHYGIKFWRALYDLCYSQLDDVALVDLRSAVDQKTHGYSFQLVISSPIPL